MLDLFNTSSNIGDFPSNTSNYAYRVYDKCLKETKDSITFYKSNNKIVICNKHYFGSLDNFKKQTLGITQDNIVKELLLLIELAEYHFENQN